MEVKKNTHEFMHGMPHAVNGVEGIVSICLRPKSIRYWHRAPTEQKRSQAETRVQRDDLLNNALHLKVVRPAIQLCQELTARLQMNQRLSVLPSHVLNAHEENIGQQLRQRPGERIAHLDHQTRDSLVVLRHRESLLRPREGAVCEGHGAAESLVQTADGEDRVADCRLGLTDLQNKDLPETRIKAP